MSNRVGGQVNRPSDTQSRDALERHAPVSASGPDAAVFFDGVLWANLGENHPRIDLVAAGELWRSPVESPA
jgi:hypothetical protein